jgi:hypothetical protein
MSDPNVMQLYSVDYVQMLQQACREKDEELAALKAATRRVVEALETVNPWCMVSHKHVTCDLTKVQAALADPALVALRRGL